MNTPIIDPILKLPDIDGKAKAWRVDVSAVRKALNIKPSDDATLDVWLVEAPWAHPAWHSYIICLLHLRPMKNGRPTKRYLDGGTHEMWIEALDPGVDRSVGLTHMKFARLTPTNFAAQFIEPTDAAAQARVEKAVRLICGGSLSPDTDYIRHWMHLFGDNMVKDKKTAGSTVLVLETEDGKKAGVIIPPKPGPQDMH